MKAIEFLNIDLDIESKEDISPILKEFGNRVVIHRNEKCNKLFCASISTGYTEENEIIQEYFSLVNELSTNARKIWDNCNKREFDFGFESGGSPNNFQSSLSASSIQSLARIDGSVVITIYP